MHCLIGFRQILMGGVSGWVRIITNSSWGGGVRTPSRAERAFTLMSSVFSSSAVCFEGCQHGGRCTAPNACSCSFGFAGDRCETGKTTHQVSNIDKTWSLLSSLNFSSAIFLSDLIKTEEALYKNYYITLRHSMVVP